MDRAGTAAARMLSCAAATAGGLSTGAPAETLRADLIAAARLYAADPGAAGCLIFEAARGSGDAKTTAAARRRKQACRDRIHAYLAPTHSAAAEAVADTVVAVLSGLSAGAREGWDEPRLLAVATVAATGVAKALA